MKKLLALGAILMLLTGGIALAVDDVVSTPHNLSTGGLWTYYADGVVGGTDQVCVFCHTPHAGNLAVGVVLWNRATPVTAFNVYSSITMDAVAADPPQGESLACLSCHDGTLSFDQLINGPTANILVDDYDPLGGSRTWSFAGDTDLSGAGVTLIDVDLSNDHPVSIQYGLDGALQPVGNVTGAGLRLYGAGADQVECASCHNPHDDTTQVPFLRISNAASALCTTCHIK